MRFSPHKEILPAAQQVLWRQLQSATNADFVLYGGTAVALQLGHRQSVDFDFFSASHLDKKKIMQFGFAAGADVRQDAPDTLSFRVSSGSGTVDFSFFGSIHFVRHSMPLTTDDGVLRVASLQALMATKVAVILQRAEAKDYVDLAAMIRAGVDLQKGLVEARKYYGKAFQPAEAMRALAYFKDGDLDSLSRKDQKTLVKATTSLERTILEWGSVEQER